MMTVIMKAIRIKKNFVGSKGISWIIVHQGLGVLVYSIHRIEQDFNKLCVSRQKKMPKN
uniref:Uncharacterized protein n=1 Tax=Anguilla anguilla TaxID=7936 RepID=A0A0E9XAJ3_ANGAN